ncbi:hypothetical protein GCM10014713_32140 [Streptomyces purpureus]|uniref:Uncharacterized protein n=1 Tax=Streptomyces purpureus TaxID=1951 RepID=A0A918H4I3_9ACTN|nr:hypothetical protein GCM10014713_32140 [Streptomyces purpureus]
MRTSRSALLALEPPGTETPPELLLSLPEELPEEELPSLPEEELPPEELPPELLDELL